MNRILLIVFILSTVGITMCKTEVKFKDPPNTAVFTTKFVIEDQKTITYVTHDSDDGAWQFFSDDEFDDFESVAKIVSIQQIVELDLTILELANMPIGHYAIRENMTDDWKIYKQK
jgi:hypothetical protein